MLESNIFKKIPAKLLPKTKSSATWADLLFVKSIRIILYVCKQAILTEMSINSLSG